MIGLATAVLLARQCAPTVAPMTMLALLSAESGLDPLIIADNYTGRTYRSLTRAQAQATAAVLIAAGHSIDMGLAQINSRTAPRLGLSVDDAFDPCRNVAAAGRLMTALYRTTTRTTPAGQHALARMLSTYNSGNGMRGFGNGYVRRVYMAAARIGVVPAIARTSFSDPGLVASSKAASSLPLQQRIAGSTGMPAASHNRKPSGLPQWTEFGTSPADIFVFNQALPKESDR